MALTPEQLRELGAVTEPSAPPSRADAVSKALGSTVEGKLPTPNPAVAARIAAETGVSPEEATQRAARIAAITDKTPVLRQGRDDADDTGSRIGSFAESVLGGASFGIIPYLEGKAGDLAEEMGAIDNPFTSENIIRRREANPITATIGEWTGIIGSAGAGAIESVGAKIAERGIQIAGAGGAGKALLGTSLKGAGRVIEGAGYGANLANLPAKVGGRVQSEVGALVTGTTLKAERQAARKFLQDAAAKPADVISAADDAILKAAEAVKGARRTPYEMVKGSVRGLSKEQVLDQRAVNFLADEAIKAKLKTQAANAGWTGKAFGLGAGETLASTLGGGTTGYLIGATSNTARRALERNAMSKEEVDAFGDSIVSDLIRGGDEGGIFGASLGAAAPLASKGIAAGLTIVKKTLSGLARTVIPAAGKFSGVPSDVLRESVDLTTAATDKGVLGELNKFKRALQFQYDNTESYLAGLDKVGQSVWDDMIAEGIAPVGGSYIPLTDASRGIPNIASARRAQTAVRDEFMRLNKDGKYVFDELKLWDAFQKAKLKPELVDVGTGAPVRADVLRLPTTIEKFQDELSKLKETVIDEADAAVGGLGRVGRGGFDVALTRELESPVPSYPRSEITAVGGLKKPYIIPGSEAADMFQLEIGSAGLSQAELQKRAEAITALTRASPGLFKDLVSTTAGGILINSLTAVGAPVAFATAYAARLLQQLATNPEGVINNYALLQRSATGMRTGVESLGAFVTRSAAAKGAAQKILDDTSDWEKRSEALLGPKSPYKLDYDKNWALGAYKADRDLFKRFSQQAGTDDISQLYGNTPEEIDATYPAYSNQIAYGTPKGVAFLADKMKQYASPPKGWNEAVSGEYSPTNQQLYQYGQYSKYVRNPKLIAHDIVTKKFVPQAAIEVLTDVYPGYLSFIRSQIINNIAEARANGEKINPSQLLMAEKLLGRSTNNMDAGEVARIQAAFAAEKPTRGNLPSVGDKRIQLERQGTSQAF